MQSFSIAKNQIMPNQAEVTFDQDKIKVAILENIVKVPANKFNPKFFSNAIKRILPEAGNQHGCLIRPSDQISSRFAETVGLNIDTPSTNHN